MLTRTVRGLGRSSRRVSELVARPILLECAKSSSVRQLSLLTPAANNQSAHLDYEHRWLARTMATATGRKPLFDKILIANRGEIACRVIRTARSLGVRTVAVYSDADADSLHVRLADEAVHIGPAPSAQSYLRMDNIIAAAKKTGAQPPMVIAALHLTVSLRYGFLSENAGFAEKLAAEGLVFIGPPASAITSMGSKSESKDIMISAGVPCDAHFLLDQAKEMGFPVLIKAVMGGGGKGMRIASDAASFPEALESARRESTKAFGDDRVLVERYVRSPRHVEVQVFADTLGNAISLWERDCSVQRRHQKIIEEAPVPGVDIEVRKRMGETAVKAAQAVGYVGAGTVEFIFDNESKEFFFMEMYAIIEHPVTEMITGLDLVQLQLEVASGNPLPLTQDQVPCIGHAFEARIYAENPRNNFLPDAGTLAHHSPPPTSSAVRVDSGVERGANIGVFYDPLIAKLITHGVDREDALRRMRVALAQYEIVGPSTNVEFLSSLASHKAFIDAELDTGFIERHRDQLFPPLGTPSADVLAQAALFVTLSDIAQAPKSLTGTSPWDTLTARRFGGDTYERLITLVPDGVEATPAEVRVRATATGSFDITVNGTETFHNVRASLPTATSIHAQSLGRASVVPHAGKLYVFASGGTSRAVLRIPVPVWERAATEAGAGGGGVVRAPMPGVVVDVRVQPGARVERGQTLVVLESMKTEIPLRADVSGVVRAVACAKGDMVSEGHDLVVLEPEENS
ncbi:carbamoyl-phosphate synthase L chain, ATP binding domain-containing protein [Auriculariales sp. MPI-PUGE-AT-0066]|nr:carbamoyl-phosphate synthase L chain, ATP binding domain-containing protein [Auriculariales sp. MPI-PUGE-AT-0066]